MRECWPRFYRYDIDELEVVIFINDTFLSLDDCVATLTIAFTLTPVMIVNTFSLIMIEFNWVVIVVWLILVSAAPFGVTTFRRCLCFWR